MEGAKTAAVTVLLHGCIRKKHGRQCSAFIANVTQRDAFCATSPAM